MLFAASWAGCNCGRRRGKLSIQSSSSPVAAAAAAAAAAPPVLVCAGRRRRMVDVRAVKETKEGAAVAAAAGCAATVAGFDGAGDAQMTMREDDDGGKRLKGRTSTYNKWD